jgi:hypothetical protein
MRTASCTTHRTPPQSAAVALIDQHGPAWPGPARPGSSNRAVVARAAAVEQQQQQQQQQQLPLSSTARPGSSSHRHRRIGAAAAAVEQQYQQLPLSSTAWLGPAAAAGRPHAVRALRGATGGAHSYLRRPPRAARKHAVQCSAPHVLQLRAASRYIGACALCGCSPGPAARGTRCGSSSSGLQRGLRAGGSAPGISSAWRAL